MPSIRLLIPCLIVVLAGCAGTPPRDVDNICNIFRENPRWHDHAVASAERWGTPVPIQMAIVHQESAFQRRARPDRRRILGFIPGRRPSSAFGYAQAQDPAWQDYQQATGNRRARRSNMADALDFIGWYNHVSHRRLGLSRNDARNLYLAYHEGHTGYQQGNWQGNSQLQSIAARVDQRAARYQQQYQTCRDEFRCWRWYQVWPFCR